MQSDDHDPNRDVVGHDDPQESCSERNTSAKLARHTTNDFGIPITVYETAIADSDGSVYVPHPKLLQLAAAVYRCTLPQRLNGKEMKFIRKAMGVSSVQWGKEIHANNSTLSRWEADKQPISASSEKLLRLTAVASMYTDAPGIEIDWRELSRMILRGFAVADKFQEMGFILCRYRKKELYSDMERQYIYQSTSK